MFNKDFKLKICYGIKVTKGIEGATKFVSGKGRGGDFKDV